MKRKIIRRLLTEAIAGSEITIQKNPQLGYMITSESGSEIVVKDEDDLIEVLEGMKDIGVQTVFDAISGETMDINVYMDMYSAFLDDFNSFKEGSPLRSDSVLSSPEYIPEPDSAMNYNDNDSDVEYFDFEDDSEDEEDYI